MSLDCQTCHLSTTVLFDDGTAETTITIPAQNAGGDTEANATQDTTTAPSTGDKVIMWVCALALSITAIAVCIALKRPRKKKQ